MANGEPTIERHAYDYRWRERFPTAQRIIGFEGGAVYEAQADGAYWLIKDEATLAGFLDPHEDAELLAALVSLERFETREALEAAIERLLQAGRRGGPGQVTWRPR